MTTTTEPTTRPTLRYDDVAPLALDARGCDCDRCVTSYARSIDVAVTDWAADRRDARPDDYRR